MSTVHPIYRLDDVADPLTIPPRPSNAARFESMRDRGETFAIYSGPPDTATLLGFVRIDNGVFIARTRGSVEHAADIRRFRSPYAAVAWLRTAVNGVIPPQPRRRGRI